MAKTYILTKYALEDADKLGIPVEQLQDMLQKSARVSHSLGNRRYHDYVFEVQGDEVFTVARFDDGQITLYVCQTCKDKKKIAVFDPCSLCDGEGCTHCDDGLVRSFVPCSDCSPSKTKFTSKATY